MKKLQNVLFVGIAFMMLQAYPDEDSENELSNSKTLEVKQSKPYYVPWLYVMHWRFS
ncbi:hypothetical protein P8625_02235 [Tenacibaculum tangerinum]|uniref:Uncharacterized protein n=1 Tax=Tenacibaculum tangerinum TaxID=3038772 RepID=A0ABY8L6K0_9FLAO|nr:hypothetical protein [Tenacibaculum tangerinum]WGH76008.1 hypothetical protein P8625_02235 [Tenacibaculum tangerinum]